MADRQWSILEEASPETDPTFPLTVDRKTAWMLQVVIRPGMPLPKTKVTEDSPSLVWQQYALALRRKVNAAILRFEDEEETEEVELSLTEREGWIIDQNVPFDGAGGQGGLLLIQVFRGLWNLEMGGLVPATLVAEPASEVEEPPTAPENPQESSEVKPDPEMWMHPDVPQDKPPTEPT